MPLPTPNDLAAWMVAQRLLTAVPGDLTTLTLMLDAALESFGGETYWNPLLASASETRKFDGPEGYSLYPGVGVISVASLRVGGSLLAPDVDYWLQDRKLGRFAYQRIEFAGYVTGARRAVEIVGVFGLFATDLPADVILALYSKAAVGISSDATSSGTIKKKKAGPVEVEYDVSAGAVTKAAQLESSYGGAVKKYRRMV